MNLDPGTPARPHLKASLEMTRETLQETKHVLRDIGQMLVGSGVVGDERKELAPSPSPRTPNYVEGVAEKVYEVDDMACTVRSCAERILRALNGYDEPPQIGLAGDAVGHLTSKRG